MAITLAEAKVGMADKVDQMIVDEFRRSSLLLDRLGFDNAISPPALLTNWRSRRSKRSRRPATTSITWSSTAPPPLPVLVM